MFQKLVRFFALLLACFMLGINVVLPVSADDDNQVAVVPTYGQMVESDSNYYAVGGYWDNFIQAVSRDDGTSLVEYLGSAFEDASGCESPINGGNHSWTADLVTGSLTGYYDIHCRYCGMTYQEYKTGTPGEFGGRGGFSRLYQEHVSSLPGDTVTSDGYILWQPTHNDIDWSEGNGVKCSFSNQTFYGYYPYNRQLSSDGRFYIDFNFSGDPSSWGLHIGSLSNNPSYYISGNSYSVDLMRGFSAIAPIDGFYTRCAGVAYEGVNEGEYGNNHWYNESTTGNYSRESYGRQYNAGDVITTSGPSINRYIYYMFHVTCYYPEYLIMPSSGPITNTGEYYNIDNRSGSITGDYGIVGDNGQISVIENQTIVNETNNTYTNPASGLTGNITNWQYDYSDRSYNLTVQTTDESTGDTIDNSVSVTYGDENIMIVEGDTTYNIYYVVPREAPEPVEHVHSYTGAVTRSPSCTSSGVKTYVCDECNDTYTETLPALGHDWQVKTQVYTSYDENGNLIQQGYTIYKCSRCGEEYRSNDSVNPSPPSTVPPSSSPSPGSGLEVPEDVSEDLLDFREKLIAFFRALPDMMGEVVDFIRDGFQFVPEPVVTLIEFAFAIAVLVGLFKLLWR